MYPNEETLRDYLSWRQVDCYINNLYNTAFWAFVQRGGFSEADAEKELRVSRTEECVAIVADVRWALLHPKRMRSCSRGSG